MGDYVVVDDYAAGVSRIKQVASPGHAAPVIATSTRMIGARDLITDGGRLYWSDGAEIGSVSTLGGTVQTLTNETTGPSLTQDSASIYFSSGNCIRAVPKTTGPARNVALAADVVTDVVVRTTPLLAVIWGDAQGRVVGRNIGEPGRSRAPRPPVAAGAVAQVRYPRSASLRTRTTPPPVGQAGTLNSVTFAGVTRTISRLISAGSGGLAPASPR